MKLANRHQPASWLRSAARVLVCMGLAGGAVAATLPFGPLVQVIDAAEREDHVDISVQFSCSVHYLYNTPVSRGTSTTITLRLGPDCNGGGFPPEQPLVGGGGELVTGARVDSIAPGEVTLQLTWSRELDFVMAPTASGLGLRVRLLGTNQHRGGVLLSEGEAPTGYVVNLASELKMFDRATIEVVAAALQTQAYVSEIDTEGQHWYRLRVGPFASHAEAERVLQIALATYPRAWVAVNDEQTDLAVVDRAGVQSIAAGAPTDPPLSDDERAGILGDARAALERHEYPRAVDSLSRLLRQPEYPGRSGAQELMGLVRERAGQLAQAKAEYEEYLRRYPSGVGAERVRARLRTLAVASLAPKSIGESGTPLGNRWTLAGSSALTYQYEKDQTLASGTTTNASSVNSALVYADLLVRGRGERYDFTTRVDAGYTRNSVSTFGGSQDRTTAAYVELDDRILGLTGRFGRQSLASQGVIGLFDGLYVGYRVNPRWSVSAAAGLPAYTGYAELSGHEKFGTVTAEYAPTLAWVFDTYFFDQMVGSATDRRTIGFQTRYSERGRTAVMLLDYDIEFQQLNSVTLIGNARVGQSWILGFDADHRRSPQLELNDALIGQTAPDLAALRSTLTPSQVRQLALDRTATSNTFVISASRPMGDRWQFMANLAGLQLSGTPASGGVAATPSTGIDKNASVQLSGLSLLQASDLHIFSVRYDNSPISRSTAISWDARFVIHGAWRLGPRLSVEELNASLLGGKQYLYLPQVRSDWTGRRSVFEITGGYQLQRQMSQQQQQTVAGQLGTGTLEQRSLYISATYRFRF